MKHSQNPGSLLDRIRRFSTIAAREAAFVTHDISGDLGGPVQLDSQLYVPRSIESNLSKWIKESQDKGFSPVLITGDAGNGKTSLLWHIHMSLNQTEPFETWFVKSSLLSTDSELSQDNLISAADASKASGKKTVLLLDTVDLLLHTERDQYRLAEFLFNLRSCECVVFAACRPREANLLRLLISPVNKYLGRYNDEELATAIDKHVARFYANTESQERSKHFHRILDAVARGMPLGDVCRNPLTLRMLFILYAPARISEEIHSFRLYEEYWKKRVETDERAGDFTSRQKNSKNLAKTAQAIALIMLAEGKPELFGQTVLHSLSKLNGYQDDIILLANRGVIYHSGTSIRFFHQTFFEHAGARALLDKCEDRTMEVLWERIKNNPNDLFITPVFEQSLLLAGSGTASLRNKTYQYLGTLLRSESLTTKISGLYVYTHLHAVPQNIMETFRMALYNSGTEIISQYLRFAHNLDSSRTEHLFEELGVIWKNGKHKERTYVLDLLERFALRESASVQVKAFTEHHQLISYALSEFPESDIIRRISLIFGSLSRNIPKWSWHCLMQLYTQTLHKTIKREFHLFILNMLCHHADNFGSSDIATRFEKEVACAGDKIIGVPEDMSRAYGRLIATEWEKSDRAASSIVREIAHRDKLAFKAALNGLSEFLLNRDEKDTETAFEGFQQERNPGRRWLWTRIVWARQLEGKITALPDGDTRHLIPFSTHYIRGLTSVLFSKWAEMPDKMRAKDVTTLNLIEAVRQARLPFEEIFKLFDTEHFQTDQNWLNEKWFGKILNKAYLAGNCGAIKAAEAIAGNPKSYSKKLTESVLPALAQRSASDNKAMNNFLSLISKTGNEGVLVRMLESLSSPVPEFFQNYINEFDAIRKRLADSESSDNRGYGFRLWSQLLRLQFLAHPPLEEFSSRMEKEKDPGIPVSGCIAFIVGQIAEQGKYKLGKAVEVLTPWAMQTRDKGLREEANKSLIQSAIASGHDDFLRFAPLIMETVLTPPTHGGRISMMGEFITKLLPDYADIAAEFAHKILLGTKEINLNRHSFNTISNKLVPPLRRLFQAADTSMKQTLLRIAPELDRDLIRLLVDIACRESFSDMLPILDQFMVNPKIGDHIKEKIKRQKYLRERTEGNEGWPELYEIVQMKDIRGVINMEAKRIIDPTFGIITALPKEFAAVKAMLDDPVQVTAESQDTNVYFIGRVKAADNSGYHHVVITQLAKMGNNMAAVASAHLLRSFSSVKEVLMVGIAGGVPNPENPDSHIRLGDVVVCDEHGIIQYDNLKISSEKIENRDSSSSPSAFLLKRIRLLEAGRIEGKYPWETHVQRAAHLENASRPDPAEDRLFSSDDPDKEITHPIRQQRSDKPKIHYGPIGSANILLKNPELRDILGTRYGVKAVEMEGSGIADASWDLKQGYIVIRGICDYCDKHKNDMWQGYASVAAAAYARALLEIIPATDQDKQKKPPADWLEKVNKRMVDGVSARWK